MALWGNSIANSFWKLRKQSPTGLNSMTLSHKTVNWKSWDFLSRPHCPHFMLVILVHQDTTSFPRSQLRKKHIPYTQNQSLDLITSRVTEWASCLGFSSWSLACSPATISPALFHSDLSVLILLLCMRVHTHTPRRVHAPTIPENIRQNNQPSVLWHNECLSIHPQSKVHFLEIGLNPAPWVIQ